MGSLVGIRHYCLLWISVVSSGRSIQMGDSVVMFWWSRSVKFVGCRVKRSFCFQAGTDQMSTSLYSPSEEKGRHTQFWQYYVI